MTAEARAADICHWCQRLWVIAVDTNRGRTIGACWDHVELLPPWREEAQ